MLCKRLVVRKDWKAERMNNRAVEQSETLGVGGYNHSTSQSARTGKRSV